MNTNVKTKFAAVLLLSLMLFSVISLSACGGDAAANIDKDREGNPITLPESIEKIVSIGPSNTEILVALGVGNKIIAVDSYSTNVEGLKSDLTVFADITLLDAEQMLSLEPDVIIVTGMAKVGDEDIYAPVKNAGICVIYMPSSDSIQGIKDDIQYLADVMGMSSKGKEIIQTLEKDIADIKKIGDTITEKKSVYFEISAAPYMYSFSDKTFLNEMIDIIGAENIFSGGDDAWISVSDEAILEANPDVILTSVNYVDNPTEEIKSRPGWESLNAIASDSVYYIDTDSSNRPSQNIIKALKEMAKAIYPDLYE